MMEQRVLSKRKQSMRPVVVIAFSLFLLFDIAFCLS